MTSPKATIQGGRKLRCFVSAPYGVSLDALIRALRERGLGPIMPFELSTTSGSLLEDVTRAISQADLLIAVLGSTESNGNIYFEIGYAYALGKRLLIVTPPEFESIPYSMKGLPQVVADPWNADTIGSALDQVLASPKGQRRPSAQLASTSRPVDRQLVQELLQRLGQADGAAERAVEEVATSAIQASGVNLMERSESPAARNVIDLAVWSDDLDVSVGNPLLIEVKGRLASPDEAVGVRSRLLHTLQQTGARSALVLYLDHPEGAAWVTDLSLPNVLFLGIHDLLDRLQRRGFGEVIRDLRNRVAHGVAS